MYRRNLINILLLIIAAYGSYKSITLKFYTSHWQYYLFQLCPWLLALGSLKSWHQCAIWRRMMDDKNTAPHLSRGHHVPKKPKSKTSLLEIISQLLLLIAVAAICEQLKIQNTLWFMGGVWGSYFMLRLAIGKVR